VEQRVEPVGVQRVHVQENDVRNRSPKDLLGSGLEECDYRLHERHVGVGDSACECAIAALERVRVCIGENPLLIVDGDRSDDVVPVAKKSRQMPFHFRRVAGVQERMAKIF